MSTRNINDLEYGPIVIAAAKRTIHVGHDGFVFDQAPPGRDLKGAIMEDAANPQAVHDNAFIIDGRVTGTIAGIYTVGVNDTVTVGPGAHVSGGTDGVVMTGNADRLTNAGDIAGGGGGYGVLVTDGDRVQIRNDGLITGNIGIDVASDDGRVVNGRNGVIAGDTYGIGEANLQQSHVEYVNHGLIIGSAGIAVHMSVKALNLVNDGTIKGDVDFGGGGGTVDNRGGTIRGEINGGFGNDTLIVDNAKYRLAEQADQGVDTIKSTVSYALDVNVENLTLIGKAKASGLGTAGDNVLLGNDGNNRLDGLDGADKLAGGKGNDVLFGDGGADVFKFATGYGHDTIRDFEQNSDMINLAKWNAVDSYSQVLKHAADHGGDVWISAGHDTLVIDHMHKADLAASDFFWTVS